MALDQTEDLQSKVAAIADGELCGMVREIDGGLYPEATLRALGEAGAFGSHIDGADLGPAIQAMAKAGEHCTSTAFCMWCQNALAWYIYASENEALQTGIGPKVASGEILGGTGLSNPMKTFFGIETMRLKGVSDGAGGYRVTGALPWVSNLQADGYFGIVFEAEDGPVMAVAEAAAEGVKLTLDHDFVAMGGTATQAVQFRDVAIPAGQILGDPAKPYVKRIRAGFVLMQTGMAIGMIRSAIALMEQVKRPLGHVNQFLEKQPEDFAAELEALEAEIMELAKTPYDPSNGYFRRVVEARLKGGEASVEAAHYAMLHCGARGYVGGGAAQRRLREAYFIAIVTPATKQLRKMLAELPH